MINVESQELGQKRRCSYCFTKFYDFNKVNIICPACGKEYDHESLLRSRRGRTPNRILEAREAASKKQEIESKEDADVDFTTEENDENEEIEDELQTNLIDKEDEFEESEELTANEDFINVSNENNDDDDNTTDVGSSELIEILEDDDEIEENIDIEVEPEDKEL